MPRYTFVLFHSQSGPWYEPGEVRLATNVAWGPGMTCISCEIEVSSRNAH